jgi:hypothetical protein
VEISDLILNYKLLSSEDIAKLGPLLNKDGTKIDFQLSRLQRSKSLITMVGKISTGRSHLPMTMDFTT